MENEVPLNRRFLRNIENQTISTGSISKEQLIRTRSGEKLQEISNTVITRQRSLNYSDIEHFRIRQDLSIDRIFKLQEENEENLELFFLFERKYFCLITKAYDDARNVFDTMLRIYEFTELKTELLKVQLLPSYDCLESYQVVSTEIGEHLVLLVNESNKDSTIRIISFKDQNNLNKYDFKKIKLENPTDKALMCANEMNIFAIDAQNSLFYKFNFDGKLEEDMGLDVKLDFMSVEKIFCIEMEKLGLFSPNTLKIDLMDVKNGKIIINQTIDLDICDLENSLVYFDTKSRMFLCDNKNIVKVFALNNNKAVYLFELNLHLNLSERGNTPSRMLLDESFKNVFLIDECNKIFIF